MKKIILAISLMLSIGSVYASSDIPLPLSSNIIGPRGTVHVPVKSLIPNIPYDVTCTLFNPNSTVVVLSLLGGGGSSSLDGVQVNPQFRLAPGKHAIKTYNVQNYPGYEEKDLSYDFTNLDSTDTVEISNCIAVVETDMSLVRKA